MSAAAVRSVLARRLLVLITAAASAPLVEGCLYSCEPTTLRNDVCVEASSLPGGSVEGAGGQSGGGAGGQATGGGGAGGALNVVCPPYSEDIEPQIAQAASHYYDSVGDEVTINGTQCCYATFRVDDCAAGRPFVVEDRARVAEETHGLGGWRSMSGSRPEIATLDIATRERLSGAWARDGLFEHASIASFSRFAIDLMAVGAPSDLVEDAHRAALDEVKHARLCLGLASAYAGVDIAPGRFPAGVALEVTSDLATLAARCASEGAIGETLSALVAAEQLAQATDPAVREVLSAIVEEEARHAELAWRTLAWSIRQGGSEVRAAVAQVFAAIPAPQEAVSEETEQTVSEAERAHGRISAHDERQAISRALEEVVLPAARLLVRETAVARTISEERLTPRTA